MINTKDQGVILALLKRFESQRLPRALKLKEKVDNGDVLSDHELSFINEVMEDAKTIQPLLDKHPEYTDLVTKAYSLYKEIVEKSLANQSG